jgi:ABC-type transport system involved in multi-copper enzyme maturation permease subunit
MANGPPKGGNQIHFPDLVRAASRVALDKGSADHRIGGFPHPAGRFCPARLTLGDGDEADEAARRVLAASRPSVFQWFVDIRHWHITMFLSVATLYAEELKATMRGRFTWLGAAVILLAVGGLAAVGTQDTWLDGYGIIAYGLVPLGFIPIAAGMIASPRANRFVECVFTAPVNRRDWLAAKFLVLVTLAAAYYVALVPMMLVYNWHVGLPLLLQKFLIWTPGLLIASIAVGTLIGVLFIGRSLAAPTGTGMGVLLAYGGLIPLQELMVAQGNGATRTGHITLASPAVLLKNALGFTLAAGSIPATTRLTWISLLVIVIGALVLAAWVFLRAQGVETWEATRRQRWTIAVAIAALIVLPVIVADTNYDNPAPHANSAPAIRGLFSRAGTSMALVLPGGKPPLRCCSTILNRDERPMGTDERTGRDLLLLLPVETATRVTNLDTKIAGEAGLEVTADPSTLVQAAPKLETRTYTNDTGPAAADGHRVVTGWIVRIPVILNPTKPWDIGGDRYPLTVTATYEVEGDSQPAQRTRGH